MSFTFFIVSDIFMFEETVPLNPCRFIDKVTTWIQSVALFTWNVAPVINVASTFRTGRLPSGSAAISEIFSYFRHSAIFQPQKRFYFAVNEKQMERCPKITHIF